MNRNLKKERISFFWRIASVHTIVYFFAGIFALVFMNYKEQFGAEIMSVIMRPIESPWVAAGAGLQIFRGFIIALVLFPFRAVFLSSKHGWIKLWALILGLSYISTIGPTFGSFEGYIFTNVPLQYHLLGIPEALIYTFLFTFLISLWYKKPSRIWNVFSIILVSLVILMSTLGLLSSLNILKN